MLLKCAWDNRWELFASGTDNMGYLTLETWHFVRQSGDSQSANQQLNEFLQNAFRFGQRYDEKA